MTIYHAPDETDSRATRLLIISVWGVNQGEKRGHYFMTFFINNTRARSSYYTEGSNSLTSRISTRSQTRSVI